MAFARDEITEDFVIVAAMTEDLELLEECWTLNFIQPFTRSQWQNKWTRKDYDPVNITDVATVATRYCGSVVLEWCYSKGFTPPEESVMNDLFSVVVSNHTIPICQVLYNHGFDFNKHHFHVGGNVLAAAITDGDTKTARWLLEHGHSPSISGDRYGRSAICEAISGISASLEAVKILLEYKLDLKGEGAGAVLCAAGVGNLEALTLLLDNGGDVEESNGWENLRNTGETIGTPLYQACSLGQVGAVKLLLGRGADPRAKTKTGVSCYQAAKKGGYSDIVKLLEEEGVTE